MMTNFLQKKKLYIICFDSIQVRLTTSLGTMIAFWKYCPFWSVELCHLTSTPKRYEIY